MFRFIQERIRERILIQYGISPALMIFSLLALASCQSADPRGPGAGVDYFQEDYRCLHGPIPYEDDPEFLNKVADYRTLAFTDSGPTTLVVTGDSTAALFAPSLLKETIPGIPSSNRGIPGDTTVSFARRMEKDILPLSPRYIVLAIGGNDLLGGRCTSDITENVEEILDYFRDRLPGVTLYLTSIPPTNTWKANSISPYVNGKYRDIAERTPGVEFLDLWKILADPDRPVLDGEYRLVGPDGRVDQVHFNEKGYRAWGRLITRQIHH